MEIVNDRPAYKVSFWYYFETFGIEVPQLNLKRAENTESGNGIYLWYSSSATPERWMISNESDFQDRRNALYMLIYSEGEQEFLKYIDCTL